MNSQQTLNLLQKFESRNVTYCEADGSWPIVWERAKGVHVWDAEGKKYLDLTAAFGVAAAGHANPNVVRAGQRQMAKLVHAMGDVHPHALKAKLARELSRITFERWTGRQTGKVLFGCSGFEAVEAALKTAMLATGKRGVIAFEGAYHGVGYGALNATHRDFFRSPFRAQLREFGHFLPFPVAADVRRRSGSVDKNLRLLTSAATGLIRREKIGAILVEPIQGRGGCNVPPPEFLPLLRKLCDRDDALLIVDEVYTGFGRTGKWFACEHSGVVPDLICLGKALTGGFPMSACVGRAEVMDAWPPSEGEAIHTSTFLGHPVGCAMALAQIAEIGRLKLCERSAQTGSRLLALLSDVAADVNRRTSFGASTRGVGLMAALELRRPDGTPATRDVLDLIKAMLRRGFILLPEGEHANIVSFSPPLTISEKQLADTVRVLREELGRLL